jgi:hypothetical protein
MDDIKIGFKTLIENKRIKYEIGEMQRKINFNNGIKNTVNL